MILLLKFFEYSFRGGFPGSHREYNRSRTCHRIAAGIDMGA
jgi:hypothetical protein